MFGGKESSNRIKISRLVQDLLNFGVLGSLWLWGGGRRVGGGVWGHLVAWGGVTTCMHMHAHTHKCMYRNCKWPPTWKHPCLSCLSCLTCMCLHACMSAYVHMHMCVHGILAYTPIPDATPSTHLPPSWVGTPEIGQNSITLELIKIFQFRLKISNLWRIPHPLVSAQFGGWVDGWVG